MNNSNLVNAEQKAFYQKNGHICIRNIIQPCQFEQFRIQMNSAIDKIKQNNDKQQRIDDYSNIFTQVTNIWKVDPATANFILNKNFAQIAADLMGVQKVRLYHDQALVKFPKAGKTPWHQDYYYWPIQSSKTITMWLPLHDCPSNMGTMKFASKSHNDSSIDPQQIREGAEQYYETIIKQKNFQIESYNLKAGDATFHSGRTIHCAFPNGQQNKKRQVITIIYFEDGAKSMPEKQLNQFRKVDLKVFCPGVKPGDIINSELNPIIN